MLFTLPKLNYTYEALEPYISAKTPPVILPIIEPPTPPGEPATVPANLANCLPKNPPGKTLPCAFSKTLIAEAKSPNLCSRRY